MSGSNQLAVYLPFLLGALLVGAALAGSFMKPTQRRTVQRNFLLPLYAVVVVALVALQVWERNWLLAAISLLTAIVVFGALCRRLGSAASRGTS